MQYGWRQRDWPCWLVLLVAGLIAPSGQAGANDLRDTAADPREQRERIEQWRRDQERRALVMGAQAPAEWRPHVPAEQPCFIVRTVRVVQDTGEAKDDGGPRPAVSRSRASMPPDVLGQVRDLRDFEGACLGAQSLERLRANLQARLESRGYITSALVVPSQDLRSGELTLSLEPGIVEAVAVEGAVERQRPAANALALKPGQALNLRDVEQTLENLGRLPAQSARFVIEPGTVPGASVVRILPIQPEAPMWRASIGVERADGPDYGELQYTGQFGVDHVLRLSDQLGLWMAASEGRPVDGTSRPLQTSWYLYWTVPLGRHAFSVSLSRADYRRSIAAGVGRFRDAGRDASSRVRWEWNFWRGDIGRMQAWAAASQRRARTYLDDIELISRRRLGTGVEQGLSLWLRPGACDLTLELEGAQVQRLERDSDFQPPLDGLPRSWRAETQWSCRLPAGFDLGGQAWVQRVAQPVDGSDLVVLGSRQTVRAYASAEALAARGMTVLRQELQAPAWQPGGGAVLRPGLALDWGRVQDPLDGGQAPRELAAVALGLRWQAGRFSGQVALQRPLRPPRSDSDAVAQARRDARWQASLRYAL